MGHRHARLMAHQLANEVRAGMNAERCIGDGPGMPARFSEPMLQRPACIASAPVRAIACHQQYVRRAGHDGEWVQRARRRFK